VAVVVLAHEQLGLLLIVSRSSRSGRLLFLLCSVVIVLPTGLVHLGAVSILVVDDILSNRGPLEQILPRFIVQFQNRETHLVLERLATVGDAAEQQGQTAIRDAGILGNRVHAGIVGAIARYFGTHRKRFPAKKNRITTQRENKMRGEATGTAARNQKSRTKRVDN
jgi:hypothetical protein